MEGVVTTSTVAPPLPPKTRRGFFKSSASLIDTSPLANATVISSPSQDRFNFNIQEAHNTTLVSTIQRQQSPSASPSAEKHVVKIRINPGEDVSFDNSFQGKVQVVHQPHSLPIYPTNNSTNNSCIRINVNNNNEENMIRTENYMKISQDRPNPYFFCGPFPSSPNGLISSGQSSPSDTLDSGTCSDLDGSTPPPLSKKSSITVIVNGDAPHHKRNCSLASSGIDVDSDDEGSNISCDSLNSHELNAIRLQEVETAEPISDRDLHAAVPIQVHEITEDAIQPVVISPAPPPPPTKTGKTLGQGSGLLPRTLLQDIRDRSSKLTITPTDTIAVAKFRSQEHSSVKIVSIKPIEHYPDRSCTPSPASPVSRRHDNPPSRGASPALFCEDASRQALVHESTYEDRKKESADKVKETSMALKLKNFRSDKSFTYETDKFYTFHLNENIFDTEVERVLAGEDDANEETFAGFRNYMDNKSTSATIRSSKGTVRGVKNRVRAGIATFLQMHADKGFKEKESGKVVVYTTTMGVVRATFHDCLKVKQILRTLMVKFEERDVFMSREVQTEIRERMESDHVMLPQLFVEGQLIGDAETVERLNETGELRKMLKPFKSADAGLTCVVCGGYHLLPCPMCNGSKKSVHRNDFTAGFVALKCMNCDEVGLVRCHAC